MNAKAIFYNHDTDCTLAVPNAKGGTTYTLYEKVSTMLNEAKANGYTITEVETV